MDIEKLKADIRADAARVPEMAGVAEAMICVAEAKDRRRKTEETTIMAAVASLLGIAPDDVASLRQLRSSWQQMQDATTDETFAIGKLVVELGRLIASMEGRP